MPPKRGHNPGVRKAFHNANRILDTDMTPKIRDWVNSLPDTPKTLYLKTMAFSKFVGAETDAADVRRARAIEKWLAQEANNCLTNERLILTDPAYQIAGIRFDRLVEWARSFVERVIGATVPVEALWGSFSGGASTSRARTESHPALKFVGEADITESAVHWFGLVQEEAVLWRLLSPVGLRIVRGSSLFTVPKNSQIDRVCCKEPDFNMFLQKGVGNYFRRRLRSFGIDLNDQTRNQRLARRGSLNGDLATLDLSSASDSISDELVSLLLPPLWYDVLNDIRSHVVEVDGVEHVCEMFSSMGNGFTFELESLIFFSLAKAVAYFTGTRGTISVYGDDIIVPVGMAEPLIEVMSFCGFKVNSEKSFWSGPFRESCGGHYQDGEDITPFFVRGPIIRLTDLIHILNQIRVWAGRGGWGVLDEDAWAIWSSLAQSVPREFWGGDAVTSGRYQLISPGAPRKRLSPVRSIRVVPEEGSYLSTMLALSKRKGSAGEDVISSEPSVTLELCRVKPAKRWDWHNSGDMFLSELTDSYVSEG